MSLLGIDVGSTEYKSPVFSVKRDLLPPAYEEYNLVRNQQARPEMDVPKVWAKIQSATL